MFAPTRPAFLSGATPVRVRWGDQVPPSAVALAHVTVPPVDPGVICQVEPLWASVETSDEERLPDERGRLGIVTATYIQVTNQFVEGQPAFWRVPVTPEEAEHATLRCGHEIVPYTAGPDGLYVARQPRAGESWVLTTLVEGRPTERPAYPTPVCRNARVMPVGPGQWQIETDDCAVELSPSALGAFSITTSWNGQTVSTPWYVEAIWDQDRVIEQTAKEMIAPWIPHHWPFESLRYQVRVRGNILASTAPDGQGPVTVTSSVPKAVVPPGTQTFFRYEPVTEILRVTGWKAGVQQFEILRPVVLSAGQARIPLGRLRFYDVEEIRADVIGYPGGVVFLQQDQPVVNANGDAVLPVAFYSPDIEIFIHLPPAGKRVFAARPYAVRHVSCGPQVLPPASGQASSLWFLRLVPGDPLIKIHPDELGLPERWIYTYPAMGGPWPLKTVEEKLLRVGPGRFLTSLAPLFLAPDGSNLVLRVGESIVTARTIDPVAGEITIAGDVENLTCRYEAFVLEEPLVKLQGEAGSDILDANPSPGHVFRQSGEIKPATQLIGRVLTIGLAPSWKQKAYTLIELSLAPFQDQDDVVAILPEPVYQTGAKLFWNGEEVTSWTFENRVGDLAYQLRIPQRQIPWQESLKLVLQAAVPRDGEYISLDGGICSFWDVEPPAEVQPLARVTWRLVDLSRAVQILDARRLGGGREGEGMVRYGGEVAAVGNAVVVQLPKRLLQEGGGRLTREQVEAIVRQEMSFAQPVLIEYFDQDQILPTPEGLR